VPYVSFVAVKKQLERMAGEHGPPGRVDRSYLTGMSGGYQGQILSALRSLDLINSDGVPTDELGRLVAALDAELPAFMQRKVAVLYPDAVDLAKQNGTAGQLHDLFRQQYGITGSTLDSAIRFYLEASKFAGLPVSTHFRPPSRTRKARKAAPSNTRAKEASAGATSSPEAPKIGTMPSSTQRVELGSGGSLVVTMSVDLFSLTDDDRTFVFDIIDRMKKYRDAPPPSGNSPVEPSSQDGDAG